MRLFSPAKINLFLKILGKRGDGYHEIASLFQAVDLGDWITFTPAQEDRLTCTDSTLCCDSTNLVYKALTLFRRESDFKGLLSIHLEKHIPQEAGLGGGSSNAATTLYALNCLAKSPFTHEELIELGSQLGSDVPFFFSRGAAYCTGRGEKVFSLPIPYPMKNFWLVKPVEGLSTPKIYHTLRLNERVPNAINDLEEPAFALLPSLKTLKENLLSQGFEAVFLTGSGTAFVCVGNTIPVVAPDIKLFSLKSIVREEKEWYKT